MFERWTAFRHEFRITNVADGRPPLPPRPRERRSAILRTAVRLPGMTSPTAWPPAPKTHVGQVTAVATVAFRVGSRYEFAATCSGSDIPCSL